MILRGRRANDKTRQVWVSRATGLLTCLGLMMMLVLVPEVAAASEKVAPQGIEQLAPLVGRWQVSGTMLDLNGKSVEIRSTATIERDLDGAGLFERSSYQLPPHTVEFVCIRSYDSFRSQYRMACIDSLTGLLDIYEGVYSDGRLVMTNLHTGTHAEANGTRMYGRQTISQLSPDSFQLTWEVSTDHGSTWQPYGQLRYRRRSTDSPDEPKTE